ncbi:helix-turn-helix domain-containing protein [Tenggerimyces flavus]|uniref:MerR family transcriptional regulator n=1 Tax=Tenggerimyces flavus TaxID=1708749 RepID=A0ABV7Y4T1_9ACTN|nr:MerR family transcriptional regulator [Tenggerimyces flavus]MBM7790534.1 DNA-binding transcriptional MerR regulator [Tenggerimyces flavus]
MTTGLRIGEVARIAGTTTRAIRHYHQVGLLPEPERKDNGYRTYSVRELVQLLRVRRFVELGLALDEIRDVLASPETELPDVLEELDAELARQETAIRDRRALLAAMRTTHADEPTLTADLAGVLRELAAVAPGHPGLARERDALQLLTSLAPDRAGEVAEFYRTLLSDSSSASRMVELGDRIERLPNDASDAELKPLAQALVDVFRLPSNESSSTASDSLVLGLVMAELRPVQRRLYELVAGKVGGS